MASSSQSTRPFFRRPSVRRPLQFLLIIFLLIELPTNLALWSGLINRAVNSSDGSFSLKYWLGVSIWPGRVWVWNLQLHGQDHNVDWYVTVPRVHMTVALRPLLKQRLEIKHLRATRAEVDVKHHGLPPEHFYKDPWSYGSDSWPLTLDIHDVIIQTVDRVKIDGAEILTTDQESPIHGDFLLVPGNELEIRQGSWDMNHLLVRLNDRDMFREFSGRADVVVHPTPTNLVGGNEVFRFFDIDFKFAAKIVDALPVGSLLAYYQSVHFNQADGSLEGKLQVRDGILQNGSHIVALFDPLTIELEDHQFKGRGDLNWRIEKESLRLGLTLDRLTWQSKLPEPLMKDGKIVLKATSHIIDMVKPFRDLELDFDLSGHTSGIQRVIGALTDPNTSSKQKSHLRSEGADAINVEGHIVPSLHQYHGKFSYHAPRFTWALPDADTQLIADGLVTSELGSRDYSASAFQVSEAKIALHQVVINHGGEKVYDRDKWSIGLRFLPSELKFEPKFSFRSRFLMEMEDLKVPMRFLLPDKKFINFVMGVFPLSHFRASGNFDFDPPQASLYDFLAKSDHGNLTAKLSADAEGAWLGGVLLELTPLTGCIELKGKEVEFSGSDPRNHCKKVWSATP